jgi:pyruvate formate lyase activating enzyme
MPQCKICNSVSKSISKELGACLKCIRGKPDEALPFAMEAHKRSRAVFELPETPPKDYRGVACGICVNECRIPEN